MSDISSWGNLLPQYQSPQAMAASAASTQNTQAQTGLIGAQTQGANIANQSSQMSLDLYKQALNGTGPGATPAAAPSTIGGTGVDPNDVTQHAIDAFAPLPTARPLAVQQQMLAFTRAGKPEVAAGIGQMYDTQVAGANQQRQLGANASYQTAEQVAAAPAGAAFETLNRYNPQAAASLKQQYADATPEELDKDVRTFAQHIGIATHQYTGRDTDFQNGVLVDKKDGKPVLGSSQVLTGLDAAGKSAAFGAANEPVTVGDQLPRPRWQVSGFPSAEAYVIAADKNARSSAANAPASGAPAAPGNTSATVAPPKAAAPPAAPAVATTDPVLKSALADHDYDLKPLPTPKTQEDFKSNNDLRAASNAARTELLSDAKDTTNTGAQALQYLQAARTIMDSKGAPVTGKAGELYSWANGLIGGGQATSYQEVAKYLGNAAIQAGHGNFGKGMTQNDVSLQKDELSPSVHMTDGALKDLLDAGIKNTQYGVDSAKRVGTYLTSGKDPQQFAQWNDKYFNRSATVNKPDASGPAAGVVRGGYKFAGGDPANKANWVKQ